MFRLLFFGFLLVLFLINDSIVYSQQSKIDSLAIKFMAAEKLSSKVNSHLPDSIRGMVIKYLVQNQLNPEEFYTTKNSLQKNTKEGSVGILKIGALRDLYNWELTNVPKVESGVTYVTMRVGSAGGKGDDIVIVFDDKFRKIIRLTNSE